MNTKNKIYVVTGATSGIGRALTERLCADNTVFAGYRKESKRGELESLSPNVIPFYVDYSRPETIAEAANYIKSKKTKTKFLFNMTTNGTLIDDEFVHFFENNDFISLSFSKTLYF